MSFRKTIGQTALEAQENRGAVLLEDCALVRIV